MKKSAASFPLLLLVILLWTYQARIVRAQRPSQDGSASTSLNVNCQTPVTLTGAVLSPGRFELRRRVRLQELLTMTGGLTEWAAQTIRITHAVAAYGCEQPAPGDKGKNDDKKAEALDIYQVADVMRGDEKANPYLRAGDTVYVPAIERVYIVGEIVKPQAITFKEGLTLSQTILMAGGLRKEAEGGRARIFRQEGSTRTEILVNLKSLKKHHAEDVVLEPNDIIDVRRKLKKGESGPQVWRGTLAVVESELPLRVIQ
ncbi:MAG TPA: SLBB domain-containing protein [Pyrinomonadaceae bacterium]|jgi:protein involved in polysaccharide export with SLBB domain|nr:SLBB domain-containing protein [Pyrinomonadaceae bacterium]